MSAQNVIINSKIHPPPQHHEIVAAVLLASHYRTSITFIPPTDHKTADFWMLGIAWELKSPTGNSKYTVERHIKAAVRQSPYVIFDTRRSKMHSNRLIREVQRQFSLSRGAKRLIYIDKVGKIIELKK